MTGRPIPTQLRLLRGNPSKRPIGREPMPRIPDTIPEPPLPLEGYACDEWYRVGEELHRLGLLTIVDLAPLAAYCEAFATWRTAREALAKVAANDPVMSGLMIKRDKHAVANPLLQIVRKAAGDMVRYAGEFGLTPLARARLANGGNEWQVPSKFGDLLAG